MPFVTSQRAHFLLRHTPVLVDVFLISVQFIDRRRHIIATKQLYSEYCLTRGTFEYRCKCARQSETLLVERVQWGLKESDTRLF